MVLGRFPDLIPRLQIQAEAGGVHPGRGHIDPVALDGWAAIPSQTYRDLPREFTRLGAWCFCVAIVVFVPLKHGPVRFHVPALRGSRGVSCERLINGPLFLQDSGDFLEHLESLIHHPANTLNRFLFRCGETMNGLSFQLVIGFVYIEERVRIRALLLQTPQPDKQEQSPLLIIIRRGRGGTHFGSDAVNVPVTACGKFVAPQNRA